MIVRPIKTRLVKAGSISLNDLLDESIKELPEKSVVIITSKIVSLCENRSVPVNSISKDELVKQEADLYLPDDYKSYGFAFTINDDTLIPAAGIDESNSDGNYLLWPLDTQKTANNARHHLLDKFKLSALGVVITDSTCVIMRQGTIGIPLAYSGFRPVNNYIGTRDLFGREYKVSRSNIASGLAAAAGVVMGEGTEQTPLAIIEDLPFIEFIDRDPTMEELSEYKISDYKADIFAPFLANVPWQKGNRHKNVQ